GADGGAAQHRRAVEEGHRAGGRAGPRGDGGQGGREGHRLAGGGRVDRRRQGDGGRRAVDGHNRGRRGAVGEVAGAREGGGQRVVADAQRYGEVVLAGGVDRRGAEHRGAVEEGDGAGRHPHRRGHDGRQRHRLAEDGGRGRRAERRRRGEFDTADEVGHHQV